jgi:phage anti-repressor protein
LWEQLKFLDSQDFIMCVSSNHNEKGKEIEDANGIVSGHAFSLLSVNEVEH